MSVNKNRFIRVVGQLSVFVLGARLQGCTSAGTLPPKLPTASLFPLTRALSATTREWRHTRRREHLNARMNKNEQQSVPDTFIAKAPRFKTGQYPSNKHRESSCKRARSHLVADARKQVTDLQRSLVATYKVQGRSF